jgi:hypothetical protein
VGQMLHEHEAMVGTHLVLQRPFQVRLLRAQRPCANSASTPCSASPPLIAASMARAETPRMSLTTLVSLRFAILATASPRNRSC